MLQKFEENNTLKTKRRSLLGYAGYEGRSLMICFIIAFFFGSLFKTVVHSLDIIDNTGFYYKIDCMLFELSSIRSRLFSYFSLTSAVSLLKQHITCTAVPVIDTWSYQFQP